MPDKEKYSNLKSDSVSRELPNLIMLIILICDMTIDNFYHLYFSKLMKQSLVIKQKPDSTLDTLIPVFLIPTD